MIKINRSLLALSLLLGSQTIAGVTAARAGDFTLENTKDFKGATLDEGRFSPSHLIFTADARIGYDDNTQASPDRVLTTIVVDPNTLQQTTIKRIDKANESAFLNFDIGVGYSNASPRASLSLGADVGVNYYFDRPGRSYDINSGGTVAFSYKLTPRASLSLSSYNAYTSEPDFGASNNTNFSGNGLGGVNNLSGVTSADRQNGDFFYTNNRIALTYQVAPRISTVTGYDLVAFAYRESNFATLQDRVEHYFSEQLRYQVSPLLTAVGEYRFGYVDYFGVSNDSFLHFVLGGAEFNFSQRLHGSFRVGVEFRESYDGNNTDNSSPYFEGSIAYDLSRLSHLNFIARYSDEEGNVSTSGGSSNTLRLGIAYDQAFGKRLSGYLSVYYTHSDFYGTDSLLVNPATGNPLLDLSGKTTVVYPGDFSEDTIDVAAGLRFSINRLLSAEVGYTHTTVLSGIDVREYDRNRYFGGLRIQF